jgi:hypothetical protein
VPLEERGELKKKKEEMALFVVRVRLLSRDPSITTHAREARRGCRLFTKRRIS